VRKITYANPAIADLDEIWDYIAADNIDAADNMRDNIRIAVGLLAEFPNLGRQRRDVANPKYLFWNVPPYVIGYYFDGENMTVARIFHGSRDAGRILD
jgi:plasmid stabilization system protein ParE